MAGDGVGHDAAMVLLAQRAAHELLGDGDGQIADLAAQLVARAADLAVQLGSCVSSTSLRAWAWAASMLLARSSPASLRACARMAAASA